MKQTAAVLMADISGSTPLYERHGNDVAARAVGARLVKMRDVVELFGGNFVSAKGDDILCWFPTASNAIEAAAAMVGYRDSVGLSVHAGLHWGSFVERDEDIFGQSVNAAARLCTLAKPNELLVSGVAFDAMPVLQREILSEVAPVQLKGLNAQMRLFSYVAGQFDERTVISGVPRGSRSPVPGTAEFRYQDCYWQLEVDGPLTVGRSSENDITVPVASVSRHHATIAVKNGLIEFIDHSSAGSFLLFAGSSEKLMVFRRSVVLNGSGTIELGLQQPGHNVPVVTFKVSSNRSCLTQ